MAEFKLKEDPFTEERESETLVSSSGNSYSSLFGQWRAEIDSFYAEMQKFEFMDPVEIFLRLSGYSARVSEIRTQVVRQSSRRLQSFRTQEIDPFLDECDRQFKLHSRIQAIREMEFKMSGGQA